jgi:hypothetical protein
LIEKVIRLREDLLLEGDDETSAPQPDAATRTAFTTATEQSDGLGFLKDGLLNQP